MKHDNLYLAIAVAWCTVLAAASVSIVVMAHYF
jgi:hypothetical protein